MILPPYPPRRAHLRSFALIAATLAAIVVAAPGYFVAGGPAGLFAGLAVAAVIAVPGWLRPELSRPAYRAWYRASRFYARNARRALLWICYRAVFGITGLAGGRLPLESRAGASVWSPRRSLSPEMFRSRDRSAAGDAEAAGWFRPVSAWALRSRQPWVLILVPFLTLLAALDDDRQGALPANIYTLY